MTVPRSVRGVLVALACSSTAVVSCSGDDDEVSTAKLDGGGEGDGVAGAAGVAGSPGSGGSGGVAAGGGSAGSDAGELPEGGEDSSSLGGSAGLAGAAGVAGSAGAAPIDAGPDGPTGPPVCGDGWHDIATEECDDGNGSSPLDSCNASCRVEDLLLHPNQLIDAAIQPNVARRLGDGRHPVASGPSSSAAVFIRTQPPPTVVELRALDDKGALGNHVTVAIGPEITALAHPVVAASPVSGEFAVVYTDLNADLDGLGIALRIVDPTATTVGALKRVNVTQASAQRDPDAIWTAANELVIAWADESNLPSTFSDVKLRRYVNGSFTPEETLANTSAGEGVVALAPFAGSWAAAWRVGAGITPSIAAKAGSATWSVSLAATGPSGDKPALVELDATHLLLVFAEVSGGASPARLRGAILDVGSPGPTASFAIEPLVAPYAGDPSVPQSHVNAIRAGDRIYVAWRTSPPAAGQDAEEIWLKEVTWAPSDAGFTLDLSAEELSVPRQVAHRKGDQRRLGLSSAPLWPEGALVAVWDDYGKVFGAVEGTPDVMAEFIPLPVLRLPETDGGS